MNIMHAKDNVSVVLDHVKRTIFVTWNDCVTASNILDAMAAVHADPEFDPTYDTLCNYTAVHELVIPAHDLDRLVHVMDEHDLRTGRTAMVMPSDRGQQNVGKVMSAAIAAKGCDTHRVFTSMVEAEVWLGLRDVRP